MNWPMHFDSAVDYWNFTRWLDRRITVTKLREELVDIVENDFEHLMSKLEHLVFINCLDVFQLSLELTTDQMTKWIWLSYNKWHSMRTPVTFVQTSKITEIDWSSAISEAGDRY